MQAQALRVFASPQQSGRRATSGAIVIALHVGLIVALAYGLKVVVDKPATPPIMFTPIIEKFDQTIPPPPPVNLTRHDDVFVPEPDVTTDSSDDAPQGPMITATLGNGGGNQGALPSLAARGIMNTHTIPPYPPISIHLNEEGTVTLNIAISNEGFVTDAMVSRSSGHQRLDDAAVAWVKSHWRYHPASQNGVPVASAASVQVKFELRNAR